ncbi:MAG: GxxExxY protein [bacterium]
MLELKSVENIHPVHEAQLLTYMRLANIKFINELGWFTLL